ncbi:adenosine deaminase [Robiginitalea myxolifaciens]|uniref:adenosine deaminase n=1 Tax=Robiginitalea myxolifaciens TaxID=400055 RepID=A0A1I6HCW1_9FLAO|nr:adenosine deaminase [Robiginitalea myxolifaciens]SFR52211.1 adenosine deaminase [Robiginitalea myxolifaciens]
MDYSALPKVELHLHLDCSLSYHVVSQIDPAISREQYEAEFIAPAKCTDLADYITRADRAVKLMQTREQLRMVTLDLFEQLEADRIIYAEIRFAPFHHVAGGLTPREVVEAVEQATQEGIAKTGIQANLILCTLRHYGEDRSMTTVQLVEAFKGTRVVGFDIAADEAGFPIDNHVEAFRFAHDKGIPCTAHAGEAKGAESMWETIENFRPDRIGHGVRGTEDPKLMDYLREHQFHLEICPTSNIQVNVFERIEDHSANILFNHGISVGINTDCRTISNTTLSEEYECMAKTFNWGLEHFKKCNIEAIAHSFATEAQKDQLMRRIEAAY